MKEPTKSELKQELARLEITAASAQGILTGIRTGQEQELKQLEETIASTESVLEALKTRKAELQKSIKDLTARAY